MQWRAGGCIVCVKQGLGGISGELCHKHPQEKSTSIRTSAQMHEALNERSAQTQVRLEPEMCF